MLGYRCYFLGIDSRIISLRDFYAGNNVEALSVAKTLCWDNKSPGFELWEGSHCIHSGDFQRGNGLLEAVAT